MGGLTASKLLRQLPFVKSITLLERSGPPSPSPSPSPPSSMAVGLWSPSLSVLSHLGILNTLSGEGKIVYVSDSGYRAVDGSWIARPGTQLAPYVNETTPSLGFVNSSLLLQSLQVTAADGIDVHYNADVSGISRNNDDGSLCVKVSGGREVRADLVVGGDGCFSSLRNILYPLEREHTVRRQGYRVYRGHTDGRVVDEAFQTWGPSCRFAVVPTRGGNMWFAAVGDAISPPGGAGAGTGTVAGATSSAPATGPLMNNSSGPIAEGEVKWLQSLFQSWHSPISKLISSTDGGGVSVCEAVAFNEVRKGGYSSTMFHSLDITGFTCAEAGGVAFVGDSGHTLDPILAQGAGVAIEDALLLANSLCQTYNGNADLDNVSFSDALRESTSFKAKDDRAVNIRDSLSLYEESRYDRLRRLHTISSVSQLFGHVPSTQQCRVRNAIMKAAPRFIVSEVFDQFIQQSIASKVKV